MSFLSRIRARFGTRIKGVICGSAPLEARIRRFVVVPEALFTQPAAV